MPVIIFFVIAAVFHIALKHTRYGKYVYAIGGNMTLGQSVRHQCE